MARFIKKAETKFWAPISKLKKAKRQVQISISKEAERTSQTFKSKVKEAENKFQTSISKFSASEQNFKEYRLFWMGISKIYSFYGGILKIHPDRNSTLMYIDRFIQSYILYDSAKNEDLGNRFQIKE
ncbi:hypothetical protein RhiirA5_380451 [Rhizophagus irregularis]|uniref:Uncharacterized protein n=1 Tax=Rhizophagus irregularis TaxID=588596 RepID=A0A2N0P8E8_9GLOM|nr:hypothetical protein RhiirA5_380451 [Rhizophagus irregularis]